MAIKATATVTLSSVVDVQSVTRYYKLQASTLAKPAKPTTNPPTGGWVATEPTYTSGSTNTLYTTDLTVFCDTSFNYSDVSKSSSYEAAKEAYNKAVNAQQTATDASKVATNYLNFSTDGLVVGDMTQSTLKGNTQITSAGVNIRQGNTTLGKFESSGFAFNDGSGNTVLKGTVSSSAGGGTHSYIGAKDSLYIGTDITGKTGTVQNSTVLANYYEVTESGETHTIPVEAPSIGLIYKKTGTTTEEHIYIISQDVQVNYGKIYGEHVLFDDKNHTMSSTTTLNSDCTKFKRLRVVCKDDGGRTLTTWCEDPEIGSQFMAVFEMAGQSANAYVCKSSIFKIETATRINFASQSGLGLLTGSWFMHTGTMNKEYALQIIKVVGYR